MHAGWRKAEGWSLAIAMIVMAVATILNVFARNLTGDTIAATEELNQFLFPKHDARGPQDVTFVVDEMERAEQILRAVNLLESE